MKTLELIAILVLYWLPFVVCFIIYTRETYKKYKIDKLNLSSIGYIPKLTIGNILFTILVTVGPGINIIVALFCGLPMIWDKLEIFLSKPILRAKK